MNPIKEHILMIIIQLPAFLIKFFAVKVNLAQVNNSIFVLVRRVLNILNISFSSKIEFIPFFFGSHSHSTSFVVKLSVLNEQPSEQKDTFVNISFLLSFNVKSLPSRLKVEQWSLNIGLLELYISIPSSANCFANSKFKLSVFCNPWVILIVTLSHIDKSNLVLFCEYT